MPIDEQDIIQRCRRNDRVAQKALYERYAPVMLGVCRRYVRDSVEAEDVLSEGFFKVFTRIGQYRSKGSFEGWVRRIMVNEALSHLRRRHNFNVGLENSNVKLVTTSDPASQMVEKDLMGMLDRLPTGYRTVFNMYAIEGYKHREIAKKLGISIHTSKSQLIKARKRLAEYLENDKIQTG